MDNPPYSRLDKGTMLISSPDLDQGILFRSVVLLCEHTSAGSFGVIINKPLEIEMPEEIAVLQQRNSHPLEIRAGGPIQTSQMMLLHSSDSIPNQTIEICPGVYLGGDLQFLHDAMSSTNSTSLCLCFGYLGWTGGQLEQEFMDGDWFLYPGSAEHVFDIHPDGIWKRLLHSMGGRYATLATIPEDVSLN